MKFTETKLEQAFIELLENEDFLTFWVILYLEQLMKY
jgi:hypothetical protein